MVKKTVSYTDYNGMERTEDIWFNMNEAELAQLELSSEGGLENLIRSIIDEQDTERLGKMFEKIILMSYGKKSPDGRRFIKRENGHPLSEEFQDSEAYSKIFVELLTDSKAAAYFITGIMPQAMLTKPQDELVNEVLAKAEAPALNA